MRRFLAACSLLFLLPFSVRASGPTYVSEIAWAGSSASLADEWLEICGVPGTDLSGWTLEGASSVPLTLPAGAAVGPAGAYLVANYADDDARSTLAVAPDLVTAAVALSNASLFVTLRDATGAIVDVAGASGTPPFAGTTGDAKASMERLGAALDGGLAASWISATAALGFDSGATGLGTPGICGGAPEAEPVAPTESPTSSAPTEAPAAPPSAPVEPMSAVRVSEIYPSPDSGEREWIELTNPSNIGEILDDWTVEDAKGTKTPLSGLLLPWSRFVVLSPKGSLNNDGDIVVLRDARGRVVDRVEYPKTRKGEAYMRVELQDAFAMTAMPTPGAPNVVVTAEEAAPAPDAEPPELWIAPPAPVVAAVAPVIRAEPA
ncbi:MAG TPA: lamin tail domain-containing protein, partial [Patescibacteria group bacterium]|nr:lamin tail domain-containing protein [Patescibacteria group bacterium]